MERLSNSIKTSKLVEKVLDKGEKAWNRFIPIGYAALLTNIVAANTGIVLNPSHIHTAQATPLEVTGPVIREKFEQAKDFVEERIGK